MNTNTISIIFAIRNTVAKELVPWIQTLTFTMRNTKVLVPWIQTLCYNGIYIPTYSIIFTMRNTVAKVLIASF